MQVVEVAVWLGDSVVELVHLDARGTFRIGSAPGSDLAVPGFARYPLVADGVVRVPNGLVARAGGRAVSGAIVVGVEPVELALARVVLVIRRVERADVGVPRSRIGRRMLAYLAGSLAVQLAIAIAALRVPAETPPVHRPRLAHVAHVAHAHAPPPPRPEPLPPPPPPPAPAPHRRATVVTPRAIAQGARSTRPAAIEPTPADDPAPAEEFGSAPRFDPDREPEYATVPVGAFAIPTAGRGLGQQLPPPTIELCDDDSCLARGPIPLATFVKALDHQRAAISSCYVEHTDSRDGTIRLRFQIAPDGKAHDELFGKPLGTGIGTVGRCVASLVAAADWPRHGEQTEVWLGLRFTGQRRD